MSATRTLIQPLHSSSLLVAATLRPMRRVSISHSNASGGLATPDFRSSSPSEGGSPIAASDANAAASITRQSQKRGFQSPLSGSSPATSLTQRQKYSPYSQTSKFPSPKRPLPDSEVITC